MRKKLAQSIILLALALTIIQCKNGNNTLEKTIKYHPVDPFQKTITLSQIFDINTNKDNVIEGKHGTIVILPKGCFISSKGDVVTDNIKVELTEALSLDKMLFSNLTTTSNGKLLETDGMIYLNALLNGEQLIIDKGNPIYIEIPTANKKLGMMAYKGLRDEMGNMDWIEPQNLEDFIIPIDIDILNFFPKGFEEEVIASLPYKNHASPSKELYDSLYYSLSDSFRWNLDDRQIETEFNEPSTSSEHSGHSHSSEQTPHSNCGIDPAIIKTIKSGKFQNTIISTREFEERLQTIFKTCRNDILELYIKNLGKNLWELDSLASLKLIDQHYYDEFYSYYKEGLTNTESGGKHSVLLKAYYEKQLVNIQAELKNIKNKAIDELNKENAEANRIVQEYKEILRKREKYRMETYGFEWSETGWINIDIGTGQKDWEYQKLEMVVKDGQNYDRIHTYIIYASIKSLYKLNSSDNELFYVGNIQQQEMPMPKRQLAIGVSIAYQGQTPYFALKEFEIGSTTRLTLNLEESSLAKITDAIKPYNNYGQENSIDKDLENQEIIAKLNKRKERLKSEHETIGRLTSIALPCCHY